MPRAQEAQQPGATTKSHRQGEQGTQPVDDRQDNQESITVHMVMSISKERGASSACMQPHTRATTPAMEARCQLLIPSAQVSSDEDEFRDADDDSMAPVTLACPVPDCNTGTGGRVPGLPHQDTRGASGCRGGETAAAAIVAAA